MAGPALRPKWFRCLAGSKARTALQTSFSPNSFRLILAASGGPRWLGLVGIDRAIRHFVGQRQLDERLPLLGSSSGAWRMAAWCCDNNGEAYDHLIEEYIEQRYVGSPTPRQVSDVCRAYIERLFHESRADFAISHPRLQLNFTTALLTRENPTNGQTVRSLLKAVGGNMIDRKWLNKTFRRGHFTALPHPKSSNLSGGWDEITTMEVPLTVQNFQRGLMATGSIPTILEGESAIQGSPPGHHLDGGILDYHFELKKPSGPVLYPHFCEDPIPGWLDRFPPKRKLSPEAKDNLCLILPSNDLLEKFPTGDFPNRHDFRRFGNDDRIKLWRQTVALADRVEKELITCLECGDLASICEVFQ